MKRDFELVSWARNTNVYEVNVRQYTPEGNFQAFLEHLPRLADMGVDVLWFMPITPISLLNRKGSLGSYYACSSYRKINPEFGAEDDFRQIIKEAHQLGMKVIIDWVANHTGHDHEWTQTHPDYYKLNHEGKFYDAHGWDDVIDLNYANQELRVSMIECMKYWIQKFDIDGFRCDMAMLTPVDFWMQARTELEKIKHVFWLAELDPLDNPDYMQVFDSAYTWKWMHTTKQCKDEGARHIHSMKEVLYQYAQMPLNTMPAWFTSNHDENTWNGTEYEKYAEMTLPLAVFSCTWPGIPLIYSGQELPNIKRLPFFDKDEIEWNDDIQLHAFYKILLTLRKENLAFSSINNDVGLSLLNNSVDHHVLSFKRSNLDNACIVMINFSQYELNHVEIDLGEERGDYVEAFSQENISIKSRYYYANFKGWSFKILTK